MLPGTDIPDSERQLASYSALMSAFRVDVISDKSRFGLSEPLAFRSYVDLAGLDRFEANRRTNPRALSSRPTDPYSLPTFALHSKFAESGTLNHDVCHELFHTASPLGGGLCDRSHPRETVTDRFAVEATHPTPWVIYCAEADAARVLDSSFAFEEVMRTSSRQMFGIAIPANGDVERGSIVLQAHGSQGQYEDPGLARLTQSWDRLVMASKSGEMDDYLKRFSWKPDLIPTDTNRSISLQTIDGLYYSRECTKDTWSMFTETGIFDPDDFAGLVPGLPRFRLRNIPPLEPDCDHRITIEGGQYLTVLVPRVVASFSSGRSSGVYQLFAIKDEDSYLYRCWERAVSGRKPRWGPLLPPLDPQRHEHLVPFDNWWLTNREWRAITFDLWAQMLTNKFMNDAESYLEKGEKVEYPR